MSETPRSVRTLSGAVAGVLAGGLTIAVAELFAALLVRTGRAGGTPSPVVALGGAFIDRTPPWLKDFAVSTFGTHDKTALLAGMAVVVTAAAAGAGVLATRRRTLGLLAVVVLAGVAAAAVLSRPHAAAVDVLPTILGTLAGLKSLTALLARRRQVQAQQLRTRDALPGQRARVRDAMPGRRTFIRLAAGTGTLALVGAGLAQVVGRGSRATAASRASVQLPEPASTAAVTADTAGLDVPGLSPFVTPPQDFYRIDTALVVPQIDASDWRLRVHGMVENEIEIDFEQLLALPQIERMVTLTCVSNEVGGGLVGNAVWLGHPLRELLARAKPSADADMVLSRSDDGWTAGTPLQALTDERRDAMLAVAMDGEPLPVEHGFPVRMVVPGLYGYVSATKWVVDLEVTRFDRAQGYWTPRGWSVKGPIKTASRIDVPRPGAQLEPGPIAVAGVAWAQHRGVDAVEVRVDEGAWQRARLGDAGTVDSWHQWVWTWEATAGDHTLQVRAVDGTGQVQTSEQAPPAPDGASGWHTVQVTVG